MKVNTITFHSRASVKIRDSFYTFEYGEERQIEAGDDLDAEKKKLVQDCNSVIDQQIEEVVNMFK